MTGRYLTMTFMFGGVALVVFAMFKMRDDRPGYLSSKFKGPGLQPVRSDTANLTNAVESFDDDED